MPTTPRWADVDMSTVSPVAASAPPMDIAGGAQLGGPLPAPSGGMPSPPLRPGQDWFQPPVEAAFGNAPHQRPAGQPFLNRPSDAKKMSSDPNRLANRFEPGDQSGSMISDVPPLSPAALAGAESQAGQLSRTGALMDPEGGGGMPPNPAGVGLPEVAFSPDSLQQLMQSMVQMDEVLKAAKANKAASAAPPAGGGGTKGPK
jgi:hypothetical protein